MSKEVSSLGGHSDENKKKKWVKLELKTLKLAKEKKDKNEEKRI